jgi:hypothetical protein
MPLVRGAAHDEGTSYGCPNGTAHVPTGGRMASLLPGLWVDGPASGTRGSGRLAGLRFDARDALGYGLRTKDCYTVVHAVPASSVVQRE